MVRLWKEGQGLVATQSLPALQEQYQTHKEKKGRKRGRHTGAVYYSGRIADASVFANLLQLFFARTTRLPLFSLLRQVAVSIPTAATPVERRAFVDTLRGSGFYTILPVPLPLAAVIGAYAPIDLSGTIVVHLGESTSELACIQDTQVVQTQSVAFTAKRLWERAGLHIEATTSSAVPQAFLEHLLTSARVTSDGRVALMVRPSSVDTLRMTGGFATLETIWKQVMVEALEELTGELSFFLAYCSAQYPSVSLGKGVVLTGGLANLIGLDLFLSQALRCPVYSVPEPQLAVVRGLGEIVEKYETYSILLQNEEGSQIEG